jgi:hypothetical protein
VYDVAGVLGVYMKDYKYAGKRGIDVTTGGCTKRC